MSFFSAELPPCGSDVRGDGVCSEPIAAFTLIGTGRTQEVQKMGFILKADLHCHTKLSDGTMGIDDLIQLAKKSGVDTIAVTDHDFIAGTVRAGVLGKRLGVNVIPAVEFTCTDKKRSSRAHILCYLPDRPEQLLGLCKRNSTVRKSASRIMALRVAEKYPVSPDFIVKCAAGSTNLYKQHIMQALLESGYTTQIFGDLFHQLFSKESPDNVLVSSVYADPFETINEIHDAGGIAVLAHPGFYDNFELLDELIEAGIDGVEVWHPENTPEQQEYLKAVAKKHKLLMTGGSDFHGGYNAKPTVLGQCYTPQDNLNELLNYKAKQRRKQRRLEKEKAAEAE